MNGIKEEKQKLREYIWRRLEEAGVARFPPPYGRIPNFEGAEIAAERLSKLEEWRRAKVVLANPDSPQRKVRELALKQGKMLIMASPKLKKGYIKIDPADVKGREREASSIKGAFKYGRTISLDEVEGIDLVITGCVAATEGGVRLGKGGGYGDREIAAVRERFGDVAVATTLHELQILERIPEEKHDQRVSIITTPRRVVRAQE
jgi:5-formyltetrahydrofolate cyclo-ligase